MQRLEHLEHLDKHLVDELAQVARETVRDELREQTRKQRRKAALYAASGAVALYAGAAVALAAGLALALVLPDWAAALITAVVLGALALALRNAARPPRTGPPFPGSGTCPPVVPRHPVAARPPAVPRCPVAGRCPFRRCRPSRPPREPYRRGGRTRATGPRHGRTLAGPGRRRPGPSPGAAAGAPFPSARPARPAPSVRSVPSGHSACWSCGSTFVR
ncbi:phage holin family protein [Streptomyces viridosporus]|uniref:phage holin family protein n=1 Tax=Streptomyces viridosporus TaxID=67581 RepID=UPI0002DC90C4|nr:phage holin family protein [Streptomyces viridosporus]